MKVYWSRCGHGHGNFGDKLTPLLLKHFGVPVEWSPPEHAELVGVGSVLEKVPENFAGTIWTSGFMHEGSRSRFDKARVLAVRGQLTFDRLDGPRPGPVAVGDAGLLCDEFYVPGLKRYKLGIIPHFVDADDPFVKRFAASNRDTTVIDICDETLRVIQAVGQCEHILSSSLHGLILADSLGIPNRWLELNRGTERVAGHGFKYRDYYSVFGIAPGPLHLDDSTTLDGVVAELSGFARPDLDRVKASLRSTVATIKGGVRPLSREEREAKAAAQAEWHRRLAELKQTVLDIIPRGAVALVADDEQIRLELVSIHSVPFTEHHGQYWGPPASDEHAISEVDRQLGRGVTWLIIAWPMAWLLDRFPFFASYLRENFTCAHDDSSGMIFKRRKLPARDLP